MATYLIFGDLHGRILPAFGLARAWQRHSGETLSALLQVGDLGYYPDHTRLDRATKRHAQGDPMELGARDVVFDGPESQEFFAQPAIPGPMWFIAGNHEDHEMLADRYGLPRFVANQTYYSLIGRDYEWELMPLGLDQGVGAVVWSPLGWGRLTGKIRRGAKLPEVSRLHTTADFGPPVDDEYLYRVVDALDAVAAETGKTVPQIALNWLLQRPSVATVIIGARNETQLRQNLGAVDWNLSPEQVAKLDAASAAQLPYPYWHQRSFAERNPPPV